MMEAASHNYLWNVPNIKIRVLDIRCVGSAIGHLDPLVGDLKHKEGHCYSSNTVETGEIFHAQGMDISDDYVPADHLVRQ